MNKLNMNIVKEIMNYDEITNLEQMTYVTYKSNVNIISDINNLIAVKNESIPKNSHEAFVSLIKLNQFTSDFNGLYLDNKELQDCLDALTLICEASIYEVYIPYTVAELTAMRHTIVDTLIEFNSDFGGKSFKTNFEWDEEIEESKEYVLAQYISEEIYKLQQKIRLKRALGKLSLPRWFEHNLELTRFYSPAGEYWYMTLTEKEQEEVNNIMQSTLDEYYNTFHSFTIR